MIPVLLTRQRGLVKTRQFRDAKYVGDALNAIRIFNEKEVDEIALLDITRSATGQEPDFELVRDVASECFMPLAYGGGISRVEHAERLFSLGVEKVIVRTAAVRDLDLVARIAGIGGSQSVSVSIDITKGRLGRRRMHAPSAPLDRSSDWIGFLRCAVAAGAGEIVLQSVDNDGMMSGLDLELIRVAREQCPVPLVAAGGVGSLNDIRDGVEAGADAIGVGSFFVFRGPRRAVLISYPEYEVLEDLLGNAYT